ncbi:MAG: peptidoglycan DD-metalloendopeptidase family protein [bacterium]|nr:peptidoglycan DD-metalloendopeptidase family protein [bacterium]
MRARRVFVVLALTSGLAALPTTPAAADLEDDLAAVNAKIDDLERRLDGAAADRSDLVDSILQTRDRMNVAQAALDEAEFSLREVRLSLVGTEFELATTQRRLAAGYEAIAQTRRNIDEGRGEAQEWVRSQYMRQAESDLMTTLISTDQVSDLGRAVFILEQVADRSTASIDRYEALGLEEQRQQTRIEEQERSLLSAQETLLRDEARQADLTADSEAHASTVRKELRKQQRLLDTLEELIDDFESEIEGLDAEQKRLEKLIRESSGSGGTSPGQLVRPVPGKITSAFGPRLHPILGYTRMHTGVDMTAPLGQSIRAGAAGSVVIASTYGGYGLTVIIDHGGGMTTLYAHQSRVFVIAGEQVDAGEVIGEAGSSGLATGPHLHFEVRLSGTPVDPADYL